MEIYLTTGYKITRLYQDGQCANNNNTCFDLLGELIFILVFLQGSLQSSWGHRTIHGAETCWTLAGLLLSRDSLVKSPTVLRLWTVSLCITSHLAANIRYLTRGSQKFLCDTASQVSLSCSKCICLSPFLVSLSAIELLPAGYHEQVLFDLKLDLTPLIFWYGIFGKTESVQTLTYLCKCR